MVKPITNIPGITIFMGGISNMCTFIVSNIYSLLISNIYLLLIFLLRILSQMEVSKNGNRYPKSFKSLPSGYVKIAIENCHLVRWFPYWTWWFGVFDRVDHVDIDILFVTWGSPIINQEGPDFGPLTDSCITHHTNI